MIKSLPILVLCVLLSACNEEPPKPAASVSGPENHWQNTYIVHLDSDAFSSAFTALPASEREQSLRRHYADILRQQGISYRNPQQLYVSVFLGFAVQLNAEELQRLRAYPYVQQVERDTLLQLKQPKIKATVGRSTQKDWALQLINGPGNGEGRTAWVLDTGIDLDHPDLAVDPYLSRSFLPWYYWEWDANDRNGHGTHVAGIIGALNDGQGSTGVAAGANLIAIKVLGRRGSGPLSALLRGLDYASLLALPGDVVNISLNGLHSNSVEQAVRTIAEQEIRVVVAAGNNAADVAAYSPASLNHPFVTTVSAMDKHGRYASFSNYGAAVDYCAPGVDVYATHPGGSYAKLSGTSVAAPHVAGLLLLGSSVELKAGQRVAGDPDGTADPILRME